MKFPLITCSAILLAGGILMFGTATAEELKVGDMAPEFNLRGSDGKTYKLSDYRGKQAVVLAWFPKAFTPGCMRCRRGKESAARQDSSQSRM